MLTVLCNKIWGKVYYREVMHCTLLVFQQNSPVIYYGKPDCFPEKLAVCIVEEEAIFRILVSCVACKSKEYKL